jgi:nucleoside-diphosphate-sugar epimerase
MRVLITGGSGFIGTNAVDFYRERAEAILSIDIRLPRKTSNADVHETVDIRDAATTRDVITKFQPTHVLHLAAKTGMDEDDPEVFSANTRGTQNVIDACVAAGTVQHVIFTSSLLVCKLGYIPSHEEDYCPPNLYGESKRDMEVLIRNQGDQLPFKWTIVRPTAIWGPWFEMPYNLFFRTVSKGLYVHTGWKKITKPNCYVGNALHIINKIFDYNDNRVHQRMFYLVDYPQLSVREWANNIQRGLKRPWPILTLPMPALYGIAFAGTLIKRVSGYESPLTLFRLSNMMTEMKLDTQELSSTFGKLPCSNLQAVEETLLWLKTQ